MLGRKRRPKRLLELLRKHEELVSSGSSLDQTLAQLVRGACELASSPPMLGLIRVIDPATGVLQQDVRGNGMVLVLDRSIPSDRGVMSRSVREQRPRIVPDVLKDPDYLAVDVGVRSELAMPLLLGGRCWGILNLESPQRAHFHHRLLPDLQIIAAQAAFTIQYDQLRAREQQEQIISQFGTARDRLQAELRVIAAEALSKLSGRQASVEVLALERDGSALVTLAFATDNPRGALPGRFAPDTTLAWQAVRQGRTVAVPELADNAPQTAVADSTAALALPLFERAGAVVGILNVESPFAHSLDELESSLQPFRSRAERALLEAGDAVHTADTSAILLRQVRDAVIRLVDPSELGNLYQQVLRTAVQFIGATDLKAAIALFDPDASNGEHRQLTITPERTYNYTEELRRVWSWSTEKGLTGTAVREHRSVLVPDVKAPDVNYLAQDPTTRCELVVPLVRSNGDVLGIIDIISPRAGEITDAHRSEVEALAREVVPALERAEAIRRGQVATQRVQLLRHTNNGTLQMLSATDAKTLRTLRGGILRDLLRAAMEVTNSDRGSILGAVQMPEGPSRIEADCVAELVLLLVEPPREDFDVSLHFPVTQGITGEVYRTRRPVPVEDISARPDFITMLGSNISSELAVPILSGDDVLAVLNLENASPRMYSPEQIASVELLASHAANVILSAHAIILQQQLERLIHIERDVMTMSANDDGDLINAELQQRILAAALSLSAQEDGYASFWLAKGDVLQRREIRTNYPERFDPTTPGHTDRGIISIVRATQAPVLALDLTEPRWKAVSIPSWRGAQADLAVPLLDPLRTAGDPARVLGVINIKSSRKLDFNHRDIKVLQLLAEVGVIAMRNRELYRGKTALLRDLSHDFKKAIWPLRVSSQELRRPPYDPTRAETFSPNAYVEKVAEVVSLSDLASNLLGWYQELVDFEDGNQSIEMRLTPMKPLVEQTVERMRPFASNEKKHIEIDPPAPDFDVVCAGNQIKLALFLLIENALNYSPDHDTITVALQQLKDGGARIEVRDHGEHIRPEDRPYLFETGFRANTSGRIDGSGIGLDHVRRIIRGLHGGRAEYEPIVGGNLFYLEIPWREPPDDDGEPSDEE